MKKILIFIALLFFTASYCSASRFELSEAAIETAFSKSSEMPANSFMVSEGMSMANSTNPAEATLAKGGEKSAIAAFLICWFIGSLGIHRIYLGTKAATVVAYILTCGGFGIVTLIDWIMLLLVLVDDRDLDDFIDNPKFLMWAN